MSSESMLAHQIKRLADASAGDDAALAEHIYKLLQLERESKEAQASGLTDQPVPLHRHRRHLRMVQTGSA